MRRLSGRGRGHLVHLKEKLGWKDCEGEEFAEPRGIKGEEGGEGRKLEQTEKKT